MRGSDGIAHQGASVGQCGRAQTTNRVSLFLQKSKEICASEGNPFSFQPPSNAFKVSFVRSIISSHSYAHMFSHSLRPRGKTSPQRDLQLTASGGKRYDPATIARHHPLSCSRTSLSSLAYSIPIRPSSYGPRAQRIPVSRLRSQPRHRRLW